MLNTGYKHVKDGLGCRDSPPSLSAVTRTLFKVIYMVCFELENDQPYTSTRDTYDEVGNQHYDTKLIFQGFF